MPGTITIPKELLRSTPRPVALAPGGKLLIALAFLFAFGGLAGAPFIYIQAERSAQKTAFRRSHAATAEGKVITSQPRSGKNKRWTVTYSFTGGDAIRYHGQFVSRDKLEEGAAIAIGYAPSNPADNWVVGHESEGFPFWLAPLVAVANLGAGVLFWLKVRKDIHLLTNGRPAVALAIAKRRVSHQHGHYDRITFQYSLLNGAIRQGKVDIHRKKIEPGTEFIVIYNPDQPKRVARYPMTLVRIIN